MDLNEGLPDVSKEEKEFSKAESDYKKGLLSDTTFEATCQRLAPLIEKGHDYHFIGKVGQFCPMKDGYGAGLLMREKMVVTMLQPVLKAIVGWNRRW